MVEAALLSYLDAEELLLGRVIALGWYLGLGAEGLDDFGIRSNNAWLANKDSTRAHFDAVRALLARVGELVTRDERWSNSGICGNGQCKSDVLQPVVMVCCDISSCKKKGGLACDQCIRRGTVHFYCSYHRGLSLDGRRTIKCGVCGFVDTAMFHHVSCAGLCGKQLDICSLCNKHGQNVCLECRQ
jgi:hypothetical protein